MKNVFFLTSRVRPRPLSHVAQHVPVKRTNSSSNTDHLVSASSAGRSVSVPLIRAHTLEPDSTFPVRLSNKPPPPPHSTPRLFLPPLFIPQLCVLTNHCGCSVRVTPSPEFCLQVVVTLRPASREGSSRTSPSEHEAADDQNLLNH